jgi:hypothetical protein
MNYMRYWPPVDEDHIDKCIKIEAEDLAKTTLLAVHEPMRLTRSGGGPEKTCTEQDLLEHFLSVDRPIPIIGTSGVGKSHIIRWLDAQLRMREESRNWHIVRIPKNASLRQVLSILLDGLEGEAFVQARKRIVEVGEALSTENLARHLIEFMGQQLDRLHKAVTQGGSKPDPNSEEGRRAREIALHAGPKGLAELIRDPVYARNVLIGEGQCVRQMAARMTQGASDEEISNAKYKLEPNELDFSFNLHDLSLHARQYVQTARLNTNAEARQSAARVLNEVLDESTRAAFRQFFQFNSGSFQDLFKEIRRALRGRTLVVLVEDMAAISAIEDVLIDSLVEERGTDGHEDLCVLRSAIAVTDGHEGYKRRRATIATRAIYEWHIQESTSDEEETFLRIESFCSRYLNAARHGARRLEALWKDRKGGAWPPIWQDEDAPKDHLDAFGLAVRTGIPLYPFSRNALRALAQATNESATGTVPFNPRKILSHIMLPVLKDQRSDCESGNFPVPGRFSVDPEPRLAGELATAGLQDPLERVLALVAIWGRGARDLDSLRETMPPEIPEAFSLPGLAGLLRRRGVTATHGTRSAAMEAARKRGLDPQVTQPVVPQTATPEPTPAVDAAIQDIEETVKAWFSKSSLLNQNATRTLKNELVKVYERLARPEWVGMESLPPLKERRGARIALPFVATENLTESIPFCEEADFKNTDARIRFQSIAIALLRYAHHNKDSKGPGWGYSSGFEDYVQIQNFAAKWVPMVLSTLAQREREQLGAKLRKQVECAWMLGVFGASDTHLDRMNKLLQSAQSVREGFVSARPYPREIGAKRDQALANWDELQSDWLKLVASNRHGMDGDAATKALGESLKESAPKDLRASLESARRQAPQEDLKRVRELLESCDNAQALPGLLKDMADLVGEMIRSGKCVENEGYGSKKVRSSLLKFAEMALWSDLTGLLEAMLTETDPVRAWALLLRLDDDRIQAVFEALEAWQNLVKGTKARIDRENLENEADKIHEHLEKVEQILENLALSILTTKGGGQ